MPPLPDQMPPLPDQMFPSPIQMPPLADQMPPSPDQMPPHPEQMPHPPEFLVPGTEFAVKKEIVNGERTFLCLADGRGFIPTHSRKDAERVVAKRLAQEDSFFVGQDVNIKQKTKQRQGTILKINATKALVQVDEGGQQRKYHVPYSMLLALPKGTQKATANAPKAKPKTAPCRVHRKRRGRRRFTRSLTKRHARLMRRMYLGCHLQHRMWPNSHFRFRHRPRLWNRCYIGIDIYNGNSNSMDMCFSAEDEAVLAASLTL